MIVLLATRLRVEYLIEPTILIEVSHGIVDIRPS
jgi:hypothetical protein